MGRYLKIAEETMRKSVKKTLHEESNYELNELISRKKVQDSGGGVRINELTKKVPLVDETEPGGVVRRYELTKKVPPDPTLWPSEAGSHKGAAAWQRAAVALYARSLSGIEIFAILGDPDLPPSDREVYRAEIHARAAGLDVHPNPTVWAMFEAARERFPTFAGDRDTLTTWLRTNAPEIARKWPDAPEEASWFDWRQRVSAEDVGLMDQALQALKKLSVTRFALTGALAEPRVQQTGADRGDPLMRISELFTSPYLKAADLQRPINAVIDRCGVETVGSGDNEERRPVLSFKGMDRRLVVNKTNAEHLTRIFGTDETEAWKGKRVVLFNDPSISFNGARGGIRIRPYAAPKQVDEQVDLEECGR